MEIKPKRVIGIHRPGYVDQYLREVGMDVPVMSLVGIGHRGSRYLAAEAQVLEFAVNRSQTRLRVAEALAKNKLGKGQTKELILARKAEI